MAVTFEHVFFEACPANAFIGAFANEWILSKPGYKTLAAVAQPTISLGFVADHSRQAFSRSRLADPVQDRSLGRSTRTCETSTITAARPRSLDRGVVRPL